MGSLHFGGLAFGDHVVEDFQYRSGTAAVDTGIREALRAAFSDVSPKTAPFEAVHAELPRLVSQFEKKYSIAIEDLMRSSEALRARQLTISVIFEQKPLRRAAGGLVRRARDGTANGRDGGDRSHARFDGQVVERARQALALHVCSRGIRNAEVARLVSLPG